MIRTVKNIISESFKRYTAPVNRAPVFIYGNQKSGTSAIASLLGEATGHSYTIDIFHRFGNLEEKLIRRQISFDKFLSTSKYYFSKKIIKEPTLTLYHHEIKKRYTGARFVFIVRDPRANIRSILNRLNLPGNLKALSSDEKKVIENISPQWKMIMDGGLYGHRGKSYIETLARRYNKMAEVYLKSPSEFILIKYENFSRDKTGAINALARQLSFQLKQDISGLANRQFQPRGRRVDSYYDFFGDENLETIERTCAGCLEVFGY